MARRRPAAGDDGFTLVEFLAAITIKAIVVPALAGVVFAGLTSTEQTTSRYQQSPTLTG